MVQGKGSGAGIDMRMVALPWEINLLPWREEIPGRRRRRFTAALLAVVLFTLTVVGTTALMIRHQLYQQQQSAAGLAQGVALIERSVTGLHEALAQREQRWLSLHQLRSLHSARFTQTAAIDELLASMPAQIQPSALRYRPPEIQFDGLSPSAAAVSAWLASLVRLSEFEEAALLSMSFAEDVPGFEFTIRLEPGMPQASGLDGVPGADQEPGPGQGPDQDREPYHDPAGIRA